MSTICDDLRAAILQAAMQGKLTKQLPEDGDAKELLNVVAEARKSATKNTKTTEPINDNEKPFLIPDSWSWSRVGDIFSHNTGKTKNASQNTSGESRKYITTSNLYWNYFDFSKIGKMNFKKEELEKYTVRNGDLLVCEGGDFGRTAIWNYHEEVCFQNHIHRLRFFYPMDAKFFYWLFYYYKHSGLIKGKGIGIQGLSSGALHNIVFPIPPLAEQKRIVEKVDELMARVADLEQSADALASLKRAFPDDIKASLLQAAMQGKLTKQLPEDGSAEDLLEEIKAEKEKLIAEGKIKKQKPLSLITDDEVPFNIPENWRWVRLGEIGATNIGLTYSPKNISKNGGTIVLRSSNIRNGKMDYNDIVTVNMEVPQNKMCEKGDILICARNGSKRLVGKAAIVDKDGMSFGAFMAIFKSRCNEYILYAINSSVFRERVLGGASTTTINQITQDALSNAIIPLPPLAEQKRIVERLDSLMQNINTVEELILSE